MGVNTETKKCSQCKHDKDLLLFNRNKTGIAGRTSACKACYKERFGERFGAAYHREYNQKTKVRRTKVKKHWARAIRREVITHYGGICSCCGEKQKEFLRIDSLQATRKALGVAIYYYLRKDRFPKGYHVLCHNCYGSKRQYGYCPHEYNMI